MNRPVAAVLLAVAVAIFAAAVLRLRYSDMTLLFTLVAAVSAPVCLHRVRPPILSLGLLVALAFFASFPAKKLYGVDATYGRFGELIVTAAFFAVLFLIGGGWRRDWTTRG